VTVAVDIAVQEEEVGGEIVAGDGIGADQREGVGGVGDLRAVQDGGVVAVPKDRRGI
jgi:hypothetical protein